MTAPKQITIDDITYNLVPVEQPEQEERVVGWPEPGTHGYVLEQCAFTGRVGVVSFAESESAVVSPVILSKPHADAFAEALNTWLLLMVQPGKVNPSPGAYFIGERGIVRRAVEDSNCEEWRTWTSAFYESEDAARAAREAVGGIPAIDAMRRGLHMVGAE